MEGTRCCPTRQLGVKGMSESQRGKRCDFVNPITQFWSIDLCGRKCVFVGLVNSS